MAHLYFATQCISVTSKVADVNLKAFKGRLIKSVPAVTAIQLQFLNISI